MYYQLAFLTNFGFLNLILNSRVKALTACFTHIPALCTFLKVFLKQLMHFFDCLSLLVQ